MKNLLIILILIICAFEFSLSQDEILNAKGDKDLTQGNYQSAIINFTKALAKNPNNFITYYKRGNAYLYSNVLDSAILDFTSFITKDSSSADAFNNRGVAYNYMSVYDLALMDFNQAIKLDSNFTESIINRATAYFNLGMAKQAFADFNKAESLNSSNPQLFYQRGRLYYYQKKYDNSIEDFSKAIKLGLKNDKIYYNRGNAYFKTEQYEKAIKDYTKVLEQDPNDTEALNNRAVSYDKSGKDKLAAKDREKLKKLNKDNPEFTPFDKINFKKFENSDNSASIVLPDNWNVVYDQTEDYVDMVISPEKINKIDDYYFTGARLSFNKNMGKQYGVSSPDSLLDFWKGSINKNVEEYQLYNPMTQKMFNKYGMKAHLNKVVVKITRESPVMMMYEVAYAKQDNLIYLYLQSPEQQFSYYDKIFEKALESIEIK